MPKSRRHGTGMAPRRRGRSSWEISWYENGKRRWETVRGERKDAERQLRERLVAVDRGQAIAADAYKLSVGDLLEMKLEVDREREIRSLGTTESRMKRLIPIFARIPASKLTRGHIREYAERRLHGGAKPATVNRDLELLRAALRAAQQEKPPLVGHIPKVDMLPVDNARGGFVSKEDYERIRDACEEPWMRLLFVAAYYTGARPGSLLDATWDRVDWKAKAINPPGWTPRNKKVGRWPIYGDFERELRKAHLEHESRYPMVEWIIHKNAERMHGYDDYRYAWRRTLERAGVEDVLLYDMRRTAATNMVEAGMEPSTVCQIVGWKSIQTMMRYVQLPDSRMLEIGQRLNDYFNRNREERREEETGPIQ